MIDILEAIKKESLAANQAEKDKYHKLQEDLLGKIKELVSRWKNIENEMNAGMDKLCKSAVEWQ